MVAEAGTAEVTGTGEGTPVSSAVEVKGMEDWAANLVVVMVVGEAGELTAEAAVEATMEAEGQVVPRAAEVAASCFAGRGTGTQRPAPLRVHVDLFDAARRRTQQGAPPPALRALSFCLEYHSAVSSIH